MFAFSTVETKRNLGGTYLAVSYWAVTGHQTKDEKLRIVPSNDPTGDCEMGHAPNSSRFYSGALA